MRATITRPSYSTFELIETAIINYLNQAESGQIAAGAAGPNSDPQLFRSVVIASLSNARDMLDSEEGQQSLETLRQMFRGTQAALEEVQLGQLGK